MKKTFDWLKDENNRGALLVVTGVIASIVSGFWILYIYFNPYSDPNIQLEKLYLFVMDPQNFRINVRRIRLMLAVAATLMIRQQKPVSIWTATLSKQIFSQAGGRCGFILQEYQCQVNSR